MTLLILSALKESTKIQIGAEISPASIRSGSPSEVLERGHLIQADSCDLGSILNFNNFNLINIIYYFFELICIFIISVDCHDREKTKL